MFSRRSLFAASFLAASSRSFAATSSRYSEIEARLSRGDLKDIYKEDLPTPAMIVDLDIFERNLRKMADHCKASGIHIRSHVKVHKSTEIARRQIASGANGLTCAKPCNG